MEGRGGDIEEAFGTGGVEGNVSGHQRLDWDNVCAVNASPEEDTLCVHNIYLQFRNTICCAKIIYQCIGSLFVIYQSKVRKKSCKSGCSFSNVRIYGVSLLWQKFMLFGFLFFDCLIKASNIITFYYFIGFLSIK